MGVHLPSPSCQIAIDWKAFNAMLGICNRYLCVSIMYLDESTTSPVSIRNGLDEAPVCSG